MNKTKKIVSRLLSLESHIITIFVFWVVLVPYMNTGSYKLWDIFNITGITITVVLIHMLVKAIGVQKSNYSRGIFMAVALVSVYVIAAIIYSILHMYFSEGGTGVISVIAFYIPYIIVYPILLSYTLKDSIYNK